MSDQAVEGTASMNTANEAPSQILRSFDDQQPYQWGDGVEGTEGIVGPYQVCVRWDWLGAEQFSGRKQHAMLQICRVDGGSVFDWRDLQQIKNIVCGASWEAVELFPDEARLKDPSNARYLWCCALRFAFGIPGGRKILDAHEAIAPQRPFPKEPQACREGSGD